jgi:hypothetical protein
MRKFAAEAMLATILLVYVYPLATGVFGETGSE